MTVTVKDMDGIDTERARIRVEHTQDDAREDCREYLGHQSAACVDKVLSEVRLSETLKGNCRAGRFVSLDGRNITFDGANMDYGTALNGPEYRLFRQGDKTPLSNVTATGYFVYLEQFKALCPEKYAQAMLPLVNRPQFIGRWYADGNRKVCNADAGAAEGLLTYREREFVAIDIVCKFTDIRATGGRYDHLYALRERRRGFASPRDPRSAAGKTPANDR